MVIVLLALLLVVVGFGALVAQDVRGHRQLARELEAARVAGLYVSGPPDVVSERLAAALAAEGAAVSVVSPSLVSGRLIRKSDVSIPVAVVLAFLCLVFLLLYLIDKSRTGDDAFAVQLTRYGPNTRLTASGDDTAVQAVALAVSRLPEATAPLVSEEPSALAEQEATPPAGQRIVIDDEDLR
jgi:uncharacterized membrane protein YsdA (DUF1294 family)